jgi:dienelactone hydrolase
MMMASRKKDGLMRLTILGLLTLFLAACAATGTGTGQGTAEVDPLSIRSITPAVGRELPSRPLIVAGKLTVPATPIDIPGELYLPAEAAAPMPAMILVHGSGGMAWEGDHLRSWAERLNRWGVAALVIDTFGPRGITETADDQDQLSIFAQVADAFAALKRLAADPRIDRNRIGIMGFSRGAVVSIDTALESLRQGLGGDGAHFALHVSLYAGCNVELTDGATDKAPMLFLHGEADDFAPIAPCRTYAQWFERMGNPVTFVAYRGARHAFDFDLPVYALPLATTLGGCDARYDVDNARFTRLDAAGTAPMTPEAERRYLAACTGWGASLGGDDKARAGAIEEVQRLLDTDFALGPERGRRAAAAQSAE